MKKILLGGVFLLTISFMGHNAMATTGSYKGKGAQCPSPCSGMGVIANGGGTDSVLGACNSDCNDATSGAVAAAND